MVSENIPKNHHYIPQFYLNGFSNDTVNTNEGSKRVWVLDKLNYKSTEIKYLPIRVIAFEKNLYTYKTKSNKKETLENLFAQLEGVAATIIRKIKERQQLTAQEKADFSLFLSFLWIRVPHSKKDFERSTKELYEKSARMSIAMTPKANLKSFFQNRGKNLNDKEITDLIDFATDKKRSRVNVTVPQSYWIKQILRLGMDIAPALEIADWEFKFADHPFAYLTSDNPFLLLPSQPVDQFDGVGLLTPGAKKIIPITAKICLIIHEPRENPQIIYTDADKSFFHMVNDWIVKYSERFVYAVDKGKLEKIVKLSPQLLKLPSEQFTIK